MNVFQETVPESKEYPMTPFNITVAPTDGAKMAVVQVHPGQNSDGQEPPFVYWMAMTEYLLFLTANKSGLPFEDALAKLVEGARTWVDK